MHACLHASRLLALIPAAIFAIAPIPAGAATGNADIVVTGTRLPLTSAGLAQNVTIISHAEIQASQPSGIEDVLSRVTGIYVDQAGPAGGFMSMYLRGAENSHLLILLDGVRLNDPTTTRGSTYDLSSIDVNQIERIEVLRGPQDALFGRNSTGGVIHYVTKRPSEEFDAYVDVMYGDFDQRKAEGAIGGALMDGVMGRLSVGYNENDGWTENRVAGVQDYNASDSIAGRAQLLFTPSDDLEILLSGNYSRNSAAVGAWQHQATRPSDDGNTSLPLGPDESFWCEPPALCPGVDAFGYADTDGDP